MSNQAYMQRAIDLAKQGLNTTTPNPRVGCVLVKDGEIIGEGFHEKAGQGHAEVNALKDARAKNRDLSGASAYVTLEPCSHHGKTPPCADALIDAGIAEVFIGSRDPNPQVSGRGVKKLKNAGIKVTQDLLRAQCDELNLGFFKRMTQGQPWVSVKLGMTLDAKIATASGESQWITGEQARADVQHLRARACAVMTSSATVIADNPSLNVRLDNTTRQPKRVVVDSQLRVSPTAKIFELDGEVLVYSSQVPPPYGGRLGGGRVSLSGNDAKLSDNADGEFLPHPNPPPLGEGVYSHANNSLVQRCIVSPYRNTAFTDAPCTKKLLAQLYISVPDKNGHADLVAVLNDLAQTHQCNEVFVEAGGRFAGALLDADLVDELIIYTAPMLLGEGARPAFNFPAVKKLADAKQFSLRDCAIIGDDLKVIYRKRQ